MLLVTPVHKIAKVSYGKQGTVSFKTRQQRRKIARLEFSDSLDRLSINKLNVSKKAGFIKLYFTCP